MSWNRKSFKNNRKPQRKYNEERQLQGLKVEVRNNDVNGALRIFDDRHFSYPQTTEALFHLKKINDIYYIFLKLYCNLS